VIVLSTHQADDIAAICPQVIVLLQGQVRFAGTPASLAATAAGRVWAADQRDTRAHLSWRGGDNRWRHIGEHPPAGADLVEPSVEDGYLLLSDAAGSR
jgi:ABC-2 type transport system ATP-binding protein